MNHEPTSAYIPTRKDYAEDQQSSPQHTISGSVADRIALIVVELEAQLTSETATHADLTRQAQEAGNVRDETSRQFGILKTALDQLRPPMPPAEPDPVEPQEAPAKPARGKRKRGY